MESTTEPEKPREAHVVGTVGIKQIAFIAARCTMTVDGECCNTDVSTMLEESNREALLVRLTSNVGALMAYNRGDTVVMLCPKCGAELHVKQSLLVQHNQGIARAQARVRVVK